MTTAVEVVRHRNTPAWVSATAAVVVGALAVVAFAHAPTKTQLVDHETRIRAQERVTYEQLSSINVQLKMLTEEVRMLRER